MPKPNKKIRKRRLSSSSASAVSNTENTPKRKKTISVNNNEDSIDKSRQLSVKLQNTKRITRSSSKVGEPKICGNGKPMPPLAELEKLFDDSDSDEEPVTTKTPTAAESCVTPTKQTGTVSEGNMLSPTSVKQIANRLMDRISNISDPTELLDALPPPPVVAQKRPKKSDIPYIVGCKDRPQVIKKPITSFCKGDEDYGVDHNSTASNEESDPKKRAKRSKTVNISKSIFNAQSETIAARLTENGNDDSDSSIKTVAYEYYNPANNGQKTFSPLPSTSKDNETIQKNEQLFNKSLASESVSSDDNENTTKKTEKAEIAKNETTLDEIEIIETPCETIVIDDMMDVPVNNSKIDDDDSCVVIIEPKQEKKIDNNSVIDIDDYYGSLNTNQIDNSYSNDVEIIDVDSLVTESKVLIEKHSQSEKIDSVTEVEPSSLVIVNENKTEEAKDSAILNIDSPVVNNNNIVSQPHTVNVSDVNQATNISANYAVIEIRGQDSIVHHNPPTPTNNPGMSCLCHNSTNHPVNSVPSTPCAPLTVENLRIHDLLLRRRSRDRQIERTVNCFFNNTNNVRVNTPASIRNMIETLNKRIKNLPDYLSHPSLVIIDTIKTRKNISAPKENCQTQNAPPASAPKVDSPKKNLGECPICMENLANNAIASTICGHVFCMSCIKAALKTSGKKCPTCRKVLRAAKAYHQIFI